MIVDIQGKVRDDRLKWIGRNTAHSYSASNSKSDISLTEGRVDKKGVIRYTITFRNSIHELFGEYVDFAPYKDRLFIAPSSMQEKGYKLRTGKTNLNPFVQIPKNLDSCALTDYVGNYELKHDEFLNLYYIEKGEQ